MKHPVLNIRRTVAGSLVSMLLLLISMPFAAANIDVGNQLEIRELFVTGSPASFDDFLAQLDASPLARRTGAEAAIAAYRSGRDMTEAQQHVLYRLLGIYTRVKYGDEALARLADLVAVPTFEVAGLPQHDNPAFHRMADLVESLANEFDLAFRNVDDRVYEITLPGVTEELVGIHAHADVVPVNPDLWVLDDGTRLDPFAVTRIGNRLYGRGTEDDKNGIVVALFAMKVIREENLPLRRTLRLLIDTTEETSSTAIPYYFDSNPTPDYNLAIDGGYPVIIAEKGYGVVNAYFPVRPATGEGAEIVSLSGGLATNQIPSTSVALIEADDSAALATMLNRAGADYALANGGNFQVSAGDRGDGRVQLAVKGVSAHSSAPASGVNPVSRMLDFIHVFDGRQVFKDNQFTDAARYAADNWGLDFYGNTLGIAYSHDFMGPLTAALTLVARDSQSLRLAVNLRLPVGKAPVALQAEIRAHLDAWTARTGVPARFDYSIGEPMYRNPAGLWVNALLDVATENLGLPREFGSSSGGTSVHNLPNGVQFGLAMPGEKYTGHNANEFKTVDQFLLDLQIVTEMMVRIGSMPAL